jgi:hypothetical protein
MTLSRMIVVFHSGSLAEFWGSLSFLPAFVNRTLQTMSTGQSQEDTLGNTQFEPRGHHEPERSKRRKSEEDETHRRRAGEPRSVNNDGMASGVLVE